MSNNKIKELIEELRSVKSLNETNHKKQYWYNAKREIQKSDSNLKEAFLNEYNRVTNTLDTDDRADIGVERDESGHIQYYTFEIYKRGRLPLIGKLDRKEMETIYNLYSTYGANLTQKIVSREFPQYSFIDFKRILRAFNIYKYDLAPKHLLEELSEEELLERQCRIKENNITRKLEKDQLAEANKLINKLAQENLELKKRNVHISLDNEVKAREIKYKGNSNSSLILHLSDIHVGASLETGCLFPNEWNEQELERRLDCIIHWISENIGNCDTIILNFLGDYLDGMDRMTARRDHFMPQNMDNREQFQVFVRRMVDFIDGIEKCCNNLIIYAVPEGNHDGYNGYMAITALKYAIEARYPKVNFTIFDRFIGYFTFKSHTYCCLHGK